jgi:hypothetical protein
LCCRKYSSSDSFGAGGAGDTTGFGGVEGITARTSTRPIVM